MFSNFVLFPVCFGYSRSLAFHNFTISLSISAKTWAGIVCVCVCLERFYLFILREQKGGRKKGRKILMCETDIDQLPLVSPQVGTCPTTQPRALTRNWTCELWVCGTTPNQPSHTRQVQAGILIGLHWICQSFSCSIEILILTFSNL